MQTFLPVESFEESFKILDYKRLGKQRVETWQIWLTLSTGRKAWSNHPATKMWRNHEDWLLIYGIQSCVEWKSRGYKDSLLVRFLDAYDSLANFSKLPRWLGDEKFHSSHRANLLRKDYNYYSKFGWHESAELPYYWPESD